MMEPKQINPNAQKQIDVKVKLQEALITLDHIKFSLTMQETIVQKLRELNR